MEDIDLGFEHGAHESTPVWAVFGDLMSGLLGAFVIGFLSDGLVIIGVSAYWQTVFTGAVIVLAVLLNSIQYSKRPKNAPAASNAAGAPTLPQKEPAAKLN